MDLYRKGDYVAQYTFEWCVGASLQMALNMTTAANDTTRARQEQLWEMAQARSTSPFGGANPRGWTAALNDLGIGPYVLVSLPDLDLALQVAARALRETKRPVGLVMWRGRHAWVMSGFESNGDPARVQDPQITGVRVLDPLYPHGSKVWGRSPKPDALITPATLAKQFVIRDRGPDEPGRAAGLSPRPADASRGRRPGGLTANAVAQVSSLSRPVDTSKMRPWTGTGAIQGCARSRATDDAHAGFEIVERAERHVETLAGLVGEAVSQACLVDPEQAAARMTDDDDLVGAEELLADDQRADRVVGRECRRRCG